MTYEVALTPTAEADLRRLNSAVARRVIDKVQWLADNLETIRLEPLTGSWRGVFKLRVGDYRVGDYRVLYTREAGERRIVSFISSDIGATYTRNQELDREPVAVRIRSGCDQPPRHRLVPHKRMGRSPGLGRRVSTHPREAP